MNRESAVAESDDEPVECPCCEGLGDSIGGHCPHCGGTGIEREVMDYQLEDLYGNT